MADEAKLRETLRKIEALFARAGSEGERVAAGAARDRVRARLASRPKADSVIEMQFSIGDQWPRALFLALCRRHGLKPYRLYRQRYSSVRLRASKRFVEETLWPEFEQLNAALVTYLDEVTLRIIREEVHGDASEAEEVMAALPG